MSGSDGNCTWLSEGNTNILIDAGFKTKSKMNEVLLEELISKLDGIIITHEHNDHFSTWTGRLAMENNIPLYIHKKHYEDEAYRKTKYLSHEDKRSGIKLEAETFDIVEEVAFQIKDLIIKPISVYHDAKKTLGFIINDDFGYISDCGYISTKLKKALLNVKTLALEFNYNEKKLMDSERHWSNKLRCLGKFGHLSNDEAIKFINFLCKNGKLEKVITLHTSKRHNCEELIKEAEKKLYKKIPIIISERFGNNVISL